MRLLGPFGLLAGAGLLVFLVPARFTNEAGTAQAVGAAILFAGFMAMAFMLNRGFVTRALASWRGS